MQASDDMHRGCKSVDGKVTRSPAGNVFYFPACGRSTTVLTPELLFSYCNNCTQVRIRMTRGFGLLHEITLIRDDSDPYATVKRNRGLLKSIHGNTYRQDDGVQIIFEGVDEKDHVDIGSRFDLFATGAAILTGAHFPKHHSPW
jgi:hypothetical protein